MKIQPIQPEQATGKTKELFSAIQAKMGGVPNVFKVMGNAPAALEAYLQFSGSLMQSSLSPKLREKIALAVAELNQCDYCLAAHQALGKNAGLQDPEILQSRKGVSQNAKEDAMIKFALDLIKTSGFPTPAAVDAARKAGVSDQEFLEVTAVTVLNIYTNYMNHVGGTEIDFPKAEKISGS